MKRSSHTIVILILFLGVSTGAFSQITPSIEEILAKKGVKPVEKVVVDGEYMFQMNVPTGERMADIQDYLREVLIDREGCYQDLTLALNTLGYGLQELKESQGKIDEVEESIDVVEEKSTELGEELKDELRKPFWEAFWNTMGDIGKYTGTVGVGVLIGVGISQ